MQPTIALLLVATFLVTAPSEAHADTSLRAAVSSTWMLPVGEIQQGQLSSGIMHDLYAQLGMRLELPVRHITLARRRIDQSANEGGFDVVCFLNRRWTTDPDRYAWSPPVFQVRNVIIGQQGTPAVQSIEGLQSGGVISTVIGYSYPQLDPLFSSNKLKREDALDETKVLAKVSTGRTAYGVINTLSLSWYRRSAPAHNVSDWSIPLSETGIHCAIPKRGALPAERILAALDQISKSGGIQSILARYR